MFVKLALGALLVLSPFSLMAGGIAGSIVTYDDWKISYDKHQAATKKWNKACKKANIEYTCKLQSFAEMANKFNRGY